MKLQPGMSALGVRQELTVCASSRAARPARPYNPAVCEGSRGRCSLELLTVQWSMQNRRMMVGRRYGDEEGCQQSVQADSSAICLCT